MENGCPRSHPLASLAYPFYIFPFFSIILTRTFNEIVTKRYTYNCSIFKIKNANTFLYHLPPTMYVISQTHEPKPNKYFFGMIIILNYLEWLCRLSPPMRSCETSEWWFNAVSATEAIFTARTKAKV